MTHAPNPKLHSHVTGAKFTLALGASHVQVLCAVAHESNSAISGLPFHVWMAAVAGLERRGLLTANPRAKVSPTWVGSYELTRAGHLTVQLLIESGLCEPLHSDTRSSAYA